VALQRKLHEENLRKKALQDAAATTPAFWREIRNPRVIGLGLTSFCLMATLTVFGTWLPLIVRELLGNTDRVVLISLAAAIPPLVAVPTMLIVGARSDKTQERVWYTGCGMAFSAMGWIICATADSAVLKMLGLTIVAAGGYAAMATFWATVAGFLARERHAVGMALVAIIIGGLRDVTHSFVAGMWYGATLMICGIVVLILSTKPAQPRVAVSSSGKPIS
jgi:ACS family 4-hydroxyphenylacetate permease-like MFS transporter